MVKAEDEPILTRLEDFAEGVDGDVSIGRRGYGRGGDWVVMVNYGHEAKDSPMVGASAIGSGETLEDALEQALGEAGR